MLKRIRFTTVYVRHQDRALDFLVLWKRFAMRNDSEGNLVSVGAA